MYTYSLLGYLKKIKYKIYKQEADGVFFLFLWGKSVCFI